MQICSQRILKQHCSIALRWNKSSISGRTLHNLTYPHRHTHTTLCIIVSLTLSFYSVPLPKLSSLCCLLADAHLAEAAPGAPTWFTCEALFVVWSEQMCPCESAITWQKERAGKEAETQSGRSGFSWHYWRWHIRLPKGQEFVLVRALFPIVFIFPRVCGFQFTWKMSWIVFS